MPLWLCLALAAVVVIVGLVALAVWNYPSDNSF